MTAGNGHIERVEKVEADQRDLRQLLMDEMRTVHARLKAIEEICRDNGRAFDALMARLDLEDKGEGG